MRIPGHGELCLVGTFLDLAFSFPSAIFTTLLLVMLGYWLLVIVGAVGFDLGADAALEAKAGALEGALEAKAGAIEGAMSAKAGILSLLGFGAVPGSVALTMLVFWGWTLCLMGSAWLGPALGGLAGAWAAGTSVLLLSLVLSVAVSIVAVKPLRPLFAIRTAPSRRQLLGKVATVVTSKVDAEGRIGQANLDDGEAGFLLSIFCTRENQLKKGDQVLLLEYDEAKDAYEVEPVEWLLPEELQRLESPSTAEALARARLKQRIGS